MVVCMTVPFIDNSTASISLPPEADHFKALGVVILGCFREAEIHIRQELIGQTKLHSFTALELKTQRQRFVLWASNLGLFSPAHSSLDYRLRDSRLVREITEKFMLRVTEHLEDIIDTVSGRRKPFEVVEEPTSNTRAGERGIRVESSVRHGSEDSSSGSSLLFGSVDEENDENEADILFHNLIESLSRLLGLAAQIRSPLTRKVPDVEKIDLFRHVEPTFKTVYIKSKQAQEIAGVEQVFLQARKELHSDSKGIVEIKGLNEDDHLLIARLCHANEIRRKHFEFWERHKLKSARLARQYVETANVPNTALRQLPQSSRDMLERESELKSRSAWLIPQSVEPLAADFQFKGTGSTAPSQRSSIVSYSKVGLKADWPKLSDGIIKAAIDFECPYCFFICPAKYTLHHSGWRAHVRRDLRPYICTYVDCASLNEVYDSFDSWEQHEQRFHRRIWICRDHQAEEFRLKSQYEAHIKIMHTASQDKMLLPEMVNACQSVLKTCDRPCPVCLMSFEKLADLVHHISVHLEAIALLAIPHEVDLECDSQSSSNTASNIAEHRGPQNRNKLHNGSAAGDFKAESHLAPVFPENTEDGNIPNSIAQGSKDLTGANLANFVESQIPPSSSTFELSENIVLQVGGPAELSISRRLAIQGWVELLQNEFKASQKNVPSPVTRSSPPEHRPVTQMQKFLTAIPILLAELDVYVHDLNHTAIMFRREKHVRKLCQALRMLRILTGELMIIMLVNIGSGAEIEELIRLKLEDKVEDQAQTLFGSEYLAFVQTMANRAKAVERLEGSRDECTRSKYRLVVRKQELDTMIVQLDQDMMNIQRLTLFLSASDNKALEISGATRMTARLQDSRHEAQSLCQALDAFAKDKLPSIRLLIHVRNRAQPSKLLFNNDPNFLLCIADLPSHRQLAVLSIDIGSYQAAEETHSQSVQLATSSELRSATKKTRKVQLSDPTANELEYVADLVSAVAVLDDEDSYARAVGLQWCVFDGSLWIDNSSPVMDLPQPLNLGTKSLSSTITEVNSGTKMGLKTRLLLGFDLAMIVLQVGDATSRIHPFTSHNVHFLPLSITHGNKANIEWDFSRPFVSTSFTMSNDHKEGPVEQGKGSRLDPQDPRRTLLELGITLLELWHEKLLEDFYPSTPMGESGKAMPVDYWDRALLAQMWLDDPRDPPHVLYHTAVSQCVKCLFGGNFSSPNWEDTGFLKALCRDLIDPLFEFCKQWL